MKVSKSKIEGVIMKENDTYLLEDNNNLEHLTLSKTTLNPYKSTRGHSHDNQEEVYFFHGEGVMVLGDEEFNVSDGDIVLIPKGTFHRVINPNDKELMFVCVFEKYDRGGEIAKYR